MAAVAEVAAMVAAARQCGGSGSLAAAWQRGQQGNSAQRNGGRHWTMQWQQWSKAQRQFNGNNGNGQRKGNGNQRCNGNATATECATTMHRQRKAGRRHQY
jgi:hypothetical protein